MTLSDLTTRQGISEDSADFASHCQTMTDQAIATKLKVLAETTSGEPRRPRSTMQSLARSAASAEYAWQTWADGQRPSAAIGPTRDRTSAESRHERRRGARRVSARKLWCTRRASY